MKRAAIFVLRVSYVMMLAALVFVAGLFNKIGGKDASVDGKTILGSNLLSPDVAHADTPHGSAGSDDGDEGGSDGSK